MGCKWCLKPGSASIVYDNRYCETCGGVRQMSIVGLVGVIALVIGMGIEVDHLSTLGFVLTMLGLMGILFLPFLFFVLLKRAYYYLTTSSGTEPSPVLDYSGSDLFKALKKMPADLPVEQKVNELLENLYTDPGKEKTDPSFKEKLVTYTFMGVNLPIWYLISYYTSFIDVLVEWSMRPYDWILDNPPSFWIVQTLAEFFMLSLSVILSAAPLLFTIIGSLYLAERFYEKYLV